MSLRQFGEVGIRDVASFDEAVSDLRSGSEYDWAFFHYCAENEIELAAQGTRGLAELGDSLSSDSCGFVLLRLLDEQNDLWKSVLLNYAGPRAPVPKKERARRHTPSVQAAFEARFEGPLLTVSTGCIADLDEDELITSAPGGTPVVHAPVELDPPTPVMERLPGFCAGERPLSPEPTLGPEDSVMIKLHGSSTQVVKPLKRIKAAVLEAIFDDEDIDRLYEPRSRTLYRVTDSGIQGPPLAASVRVLYAVRAGEDPPQDIEEEPEPPSFLISFNNKEYLTTAEFVSTAAASDDPAAYLQRSGEPMKSRGVSDRSFAPLSVVVAEARKCVFVGIHAPAYMRLFQRSSLIYFEHLDAHAVAPLVELAELLPYESLRQLTAYRYMRNAEHHGDPAPLPHCPTIVFTGRGLGGAIAHIAAMRMKLVLGSEHARTFKALGLAFNAPFCGNASLSQVTTRFSYDADLINVVDRDPLVFCLNLALGATAGLNRSAHTHPEVATFVERLVALLSPDDEARGKALVGRLPIETVEDVVASCQTQLSSVGTVLRRNGTRYMRVEADDANEVLRSIFRENSLASRPTSSPQAGQARSTGPKTPTNRFASISSRVPFARCGERKKTRTPSLAPHITQKSAKRIGESIDRTCDGDTLLITLAGTGLDSSLRSIERISLLSNADDPLRPLDLLRPETDFEPLGDLASVQTLPPSTSTNAQFHAQGVRVREKHKPRFVLRTLFGRVEFEIKKIQFTKQLRSAEVLHSKMDTQFLLDAFARGMLTDVYGPTRPEEPPATFPPQSLLGLLIQLEITLFRRESVIEATVRRYWQRDRSFVDIRLACIGVTPVLKEILNAIEQDVTLDFGLNNPLRKIVGALGMAFGGLITAFGGAATFVVSIPSALFVGLPTAAIAKISKAKDPLEKGAIAMAVPCLIPGLLTYGGAKLTQASYRALRTTNANLNYQDSLRTFLVMLGERPEKELVVSRLEQRILERYAHLTRHHQCLATATNEQVERVLLKCAKKQTSNRFDKLKAPAHRQKICLRLRAIGVVHQIRRLMTCSTYISFVGVHNAGKSTWMGKLFGLNTRADLLTRTEIPEVHQPHSLGQCDCTPMFFVDFPGTTDERPEIAQMCQTFLGISSLAICVFRIGHIAKPERDVVDTVKAREKPYLILINQRDTLVDATMTDAQLIENYAKVLRVDPSTILLTTTERPEEVERVRLAIFKFLRVLYGGDDVGREALDGITPRLVHPEVYEAMSEHASRVGLRNRLNAHINDCFARDVLPALETLDDWEEYAARKQRLEAGELLDGGAHDMGVLPELLAERNAGLSEQEALAVLRAYCRMGFSVDQVREAVMACLERRRSDSMAILDELIASREPSPSEQPVAPREPKKESPGRAQNLWQRVQSIRVPFARLGSYAPVEIPKQPSCIDSQALQSKQQEFLEELRQLGDFLPEEARLLAVLATSVVSIRVDPANPLSTLEAFDKIPASQMRGILFVLDGTEQIDFGGPLRAYFETLARAITAGAQARSIPYFALARDRILYPSIDSAILWQGGCTETVTFFHALGRMLGTTFLRAKEMNLQLPIPFALPVFKAILGAPLTLEDLRELDLEEYHAVKTICEQADRGMDAEALALFGAMEMPSTSGDLVAVPLLEGGEEVVVTNANLFEYLANRIAVKLGVGLNAAIGPREPVPRIEGPIRPTHRFETPLNLLVSGVQEVVPIHLLRRFTPIELSVIARGSSVVDVNDWRAHVRYRGFLDTPAHESVRNWFWVLVREMDDMRRAVVLLFATGASSPPCGGFADFTPPFTLHYHADAGENALPTASTCSNEIHIPPYRTLDAFRAKFNQSLDGFEAHGFQLR